MFWILLSTHSLCLSACFMVFVCPRGSWSEAIKTQKIWTQSKQLRANRTTALNFTLNRGRSRERWRRGAGQCFVFIFCSCQNSQVFLFPLLPALNERHLIEFDGFTLIRAAAVIAALLPLRLHLPYLMPQILVHDFYCLLYYCISRGICFKYALSLCLSEPMAFVPAAVCCADFIADFYAQRLLCFTFSRLFLTPFLLLLLL